MKAAHSPQAWLHQNEAMALPSAASWVPPSHEEAQPTAMTASNQCKAASSPGGRHFVPFAHCSLQLPFSSLSFRYLSSGLETDHSSPLSSH